MGPEEADLIGKDWAGGYGNVSWVGQNILTFVQEVIEKEVVWEKRGQDLRVLCPGVFVTYCFTANHRLAPKDSKRLSPQGF